MIRAGEVLEALDEDKQYHTVLIFNNMIYSFEEWEERLHRADLKITEMQSVPIFGTYVIVIKLEKVGDPFAKEEDS